MGTEDTRIPARTRRQAMDWSLVLVSQGIESTVDFSAEESRWGLWVSGGDYQRAVDLIRLYRIENQAWRWQRQVLSTGIIFDWGALAWPLLLAFFYILEVQMGLRDPAHMDVTEVSHGAWWRLFTAVWLHADFGHLAANATLGTLLLGLAMGRYGTGAGLLAGYLAGAGGNVVAMLLSSGPRHSLGASGMVMGCLGLLAMQSVWDWRSRSHSLKWTLSGILAGVMLFVLLGLAPETDVLAHFGGFVSGLVLGGLVGSIPKVARRPWLNLAAGGAFILLTVLPWWLALRAAR